MIRKGILSQLRNILNTPPTFKIFILFPFELASEEVMGSQTQELITKLTYQLTTEVVLRQENGTTCTKQQLSPRSRERRMEIFVFGRSVPEKRGGPKMSFASWLSINHASAPSFRPETDRRADRRARDRDRPGRRRRSPPRPSPSPPPSLSFVAKGKRKPSSSPLRPPNRRLVQIGNEAQPKALQGSL